MRRDDHLQLYATVVAGMMALLLAGCASPSSLADGRARTVTVVPVVLQEFSYSPTHIEARVGEQVTLVLQNQGSVVHEFVIGRELHTDDGVLVGFVDDFFVTAGFVPSVVGEEADEATRPRMRLVGKRISAVPLAPPADHEGGLGAKPNDSIFIVAPHNDGLAITFLVTPAMVGEWEIGCFQAGGMHYTAGMQGTLSIQK